MAKDPPDGNRGGRPGKAGGLPSRTGCYLMRDGAGRVLYVGKAKDIRGRVAKHLSAPDGPRARALAAKVRDVEFLLTSTETEALILENNLIKEHAPRYNVVMRDDKSYPYVQADLREDFPRLELTRRPRRGPGREVFGPFVHGSRIGEVLRVVTKAFRLRDCSLREFRGRREPCLLHAMGQCSGPCRGLVGREDYRRSLGLALDLFRGREGGALAALEEEMRRCAEEERFERAAAVRDGLAALRAFVGAHRSQNVEFPGTGGDLDVAAFHEGGEEVDIAIYVVRHGLLLGHRSFHFPLSDCGEGGVPEEVLRCLLQHYGGPDPPPRRICPALPPAALRRFREAVLARFGPGVRVARPTGGVRRLAETTAGHAEERQRGRARRRRDALAARERLAALLGRADPPSLIECFDVAVFRGSSPTASQVVFRDGEPVRAAWRHYRLAERPEGDNDAAMMGELFARRALRGGFPDLFVVDGGAVQAGAARRALAGTAGEGVPVVGVAKGRPGGPGERLVVPGRRDPWPLDRFPPLLRLLASMRDEAHRFARRLHHGAESRRHFRSWLDTVEGAGPKTRRRILEGLDVPLAEVASMPPRFLASRLRIGTALAERVARAARLWLEDD